MLLAERIQINPAVALGRPVIRGTRIPAELIIRKLSEGATEAELLDAYPRLTREDIQAALAYAADSLAHFFNHLIDGLKEKQRLEQRLKERMAELQAQTQKLSTLNALAATVSQSLDLKVVLNTALDKVLELLLL